jgi:hypothetical protein
VHRLAQSDVDFASPVQRGKPDVRAGRGFDLHGLPFIDGRCVCGAGGKEEAEAGE